MRVPELAHCSWSSPRHDRLDAPKHLSAEHLTRLARRSHTLRPVILLACGLHRRLTLRLGGGDLSPFLESAIKRSGAYSSGTFTRKLSTACSFWLFTS